MGVGNICAVGVAAFMVLGVEAAEPLIWSESFDEPALAGKGIYGDESGQVVVRMDGVTNWNVDVSAAEMNTSDSYVAVTNGCLEARMTGGPVIWSSQRLAIDDAASIGIEVDIREVGSSEMTDWVAVTYLVDGYTGVVGRADGDFGSTTLATHGVAGTGLVVVVTLCNSASDERHRIEEVRVFSEPAMTNRLPPVVEVSPSREAICVAVGLQLQFDVQARAAVPEWVSVEAMGLPDGSTCPRVEAMGVSSTRFRWRPGKPGISPLRFVAESASGRSEKELTVCVHASDWIWINEFHYDNTSIDQAEGVELAGSYGRSLSGLALEACNGLDGGLVSGQHYSLSGRLGGGNVSLGVRWQPISGLQNGPDGVVLSGGVCRSTCVWDVVGYEGDFLVMAGAAAGIVAEGIGVEELPGEPVGLSLQRRGTGWGRDAFVWTGPLAATPDAINEGQVARGKPTLFIVQ
jgi:hypothetical protein